MINIKRIATRLKKRITPFFDLSAWVLLIVSAIPLAVIDRPMFDTLVQWTVFAIALAGISVVLCRLLLPQIDLTAYLAEAKKGSVSAAIVVFSVAFLLSALFMGLVLWAKP